MKKTNTGITCRTFAGFIFALVMASMLVLPDPELEMLVTFKLGTAPVRIAEIHKTVGGTVKEESPDHIQAIVVPAPDQNFLTMGTRYLSFREVVAAEGICKEQNTTI